MYAVGPFVNYMNLILVSIVAPVIALVFFFLIPESPYFLYAKGKTEYAQETIQWLKRGASKEEVQLEIDSVQVIRNNNFINELLRVLYSQKRWENSQTQTFSEEVDFIFNRKHIKS